MSCHQFSANELSHFESHRISTSFVEDFQAFSDWFNFQPIGFKTVKYMVIENWPKFVVDIMPELDRMCSRIQSKIIDEAIFVL